MAVNQEPALRRTAVAPEPRQRTGELGEGLAEKGKSEGRARKSKTERARRDVERHHMERICSLFRAHGKGWMKKEVLSLGEIIFLIDGCDESLTNFVPVVLFRLYGPGVFPPNFVEVRPAVPRL